MRRSIASCSLAIGIIAIYVASCHAQSDIPKIHYQRYSLPNGLTLIVVPNHREPIVSVSIWFHVGSSDDGLHKSGLAHLVEHMMFEGSEHHKSNFISAVEQSGATGVNGVTNPDRTAYTETVPSSALDYTLWLEADRMAHLLGGIDEKQLAAQIDVIENEKWQGEGGSDAVARQLIADNTYPPGHPYRGSTIGTIGGLRTASLDDLKNWMREYYGASNAVLVLAGDIDPVIARQKVQKYFGDMAPGSPPAPRAAWIAKMSGNHRHVVRARISRVRILNVWNIPGFGTADGNYLDLISDCLNEDFRDMDRALGSERRSEEPHIEARASVQLGEVGGQFRIAATVNGDDSLDDVERKLDEVVHRFLEHGPTLTQLRRIEQLYVARYATALETLSGPGSASEKLLQGQMFRSDSDVYWKDLRQALSATPAQIQTSARRWLSDGCFSLEIIPNTRDSAATSSEPPVVETFSGPKLPTLQRATLPNGMRLILVERHDLPMIELTMIVGAGYSADPPALPGTACLTAEMLDGSAIGRSGLNASEQLADLGASLQMDCTFEVSTVRISALSAHLNRAIGILGDLTMHPSFSGEGLERKRREELASIHAEAGFPLFVAMRALSPLLYDPGSAWPNPFFRGGNVQDLSRITLDDIREFQRTWFRPNNSTLLIVGDATMESLRPRLHQIFNQWVAGAVPNRRANRVRESSVHGVYFVDRPGSPQSFILAATLGFNKADPSDLAAQLLNDTLDGTLGSRLNMILREEKHWSYGVSSRFYGTEQRQPLLTYTSVQSDKTADAITEMKKQFAAIIAERPVAADELNRSKANRLLELSTSLETIRSTTQFLINMVAYQLPDDYVQTLPGRIARLTTAQLQDVADRLIQPDDLIWIIVGDRARVEPGLKGAALGDLHALNDVTVE